MFSDSSLAGRACRRRWPHLSLLLSILVCLAPAACRRATDQEAAIPYSTLKQHVAAGEVREVRLSANRIEAVPTEKARSAGAPALWSAVPVPDQELVPLLNANNVVYQGFSASSGLSPAAVAVFAGVVVIGLLLVMWRRVNPASGLLGLGRQNLRDARARSATRFTDVAGVDEAREELEEIVSFLQQPDRFAALGARIPKGVLLVGPPGTGKTLLARAVAGEADVPFYPVSGSEFQEVFVGVGASRVRKLFKKAKAHAPAIIFIDELDAIGRTRSAASAGANEEREHTLNQLLVELDGFTGRDGLIVMGASNRAETLDAALLRPGRFDRQVLVDRPDPSGREAILRVHARRLTLAADVNLGDVARRTAGFVGADLENMLNEAALIAARHAKAAVGMIELDAAIDRVVAGLERKRRMTSDKERRLVAFHEAGHAIVAELSPHADPVQKVSIVPRGAAALGYVQQVMEDRLVLQEDELMDRLAVLLGGRAAELIVFQQLSTGASNDLERATTLARRMVCQFGMSDAIGPVAFLPQGPRAGSSGEEGSAWSDQVTARIETEVQALLARAFDRACGTLKPRRAALDAVATALLERGTLERADLQALISAS